MSGPTMAGSKTQPLAKCQLSRAPRMVLSMLVNSFLRSENIIESSVSRRHVTFSQQLQVQEADHPQGIERTEEKGGKLPVDLLDLVKLAKIAISPVLGKGLAEFEVAFTNPQFLNAVLQGRR
jgi:hypothetical protein